MTKKEPEFEGLNEPESYITTWWKKIVTQELAHAGTLTAMPVFG